MDASTMQDSDFLVLHLLRKNKRADHQNWHGTSEDRQKNKWKNSKWDCKDITDLLQLLCGESTQMRGSVDLFSKKQILKKDISHYVTNQHMAACVSF